jgi:hypothetical protein
MQDPRDNRIYTDENGDQWLTDENGKVLTDERGRNIPPTQSQKISKDGDFTIYDDSRGHCALCGSLYCRGGCCK